jgi:hypothetical protein
MMLASSTKPKRGGDQKTQEEKRTKRREIQTQTKKEEEKRNEKSWRTLRERSLRDKSQNTEKH